MSSTLTHKKPKNLVPAIQVIQNLYDTLGLEHSPNQTGGVLGLLFDSISIGINLVGSASATRTIPAAVESSLNITGSQTVAGGCAVNNGPTRMITTLTEFNDDYYLYGGTIGPDWKINRFEVGNVIAKKSAMQSNNPTYSTLADAWAARATLVYEAM